MRLHSARIAGPPRRWIAPSTPPPPIKEELAAFTTASTSCAVMSPSASETRGTFGILSRAAIGKDDARRIPSGRAADAAARMRAGAAQVEAAHRRAWPEPLAEDLSGQDLAVEDVPPGHAEARLEVGRPEDLPVDDRRLDVRRVCGERVDDGVPRTFAHLLPPLARHGARRVLGEARGDVLTLGRKGRIADRLDENLHERPVRDATGLRVLECGLQVVDGRRDLD